MLSSQGPCPFQPLTNGVMLTCRLGGRQAHRGKPPLSGVQSAAALQCRGCYLSVTCNAGSVLYQVYRANRKLRPPKRRPFRKHRFSSLNCAMEDTVCCGFSENRPLLPISWLPPSLGPAWFLTQTVLPASCSPVTSLQPPQQPG